MEYFHSLMPQLIRFLLKILGDFCKNGHIKIFSSDYTHIFSILWAFELDFFAYTHLTKKCLKQSIEIGYTSMIFLYMPKIEKNLHFISLTLRANSSFTSYTQKKSLKSDFFKTEKEGFEPSRRY